VLRNESELKYQRLKVPPALHLRWDFKENIDQHIQRNNEVVYVWRAEPGLVVANGKHGIESSTH
jgi:hypothetical protein